MNTIERLSPRQADILAAISARFTEKVAALPADDASALNTLEKRGLIHRASATSRVRISNEGVQALERVLNKQSKNLAPLAADDWALLAAVRAEPDYEFCDEEFEQALALVADGLLRKGATENRFVLTTKGLARFRLKA